MKRKHVDHTNFTFFLVCKYWSHIEDHCLKVVRRAARAYRALWCNQLTFFIKSWKWDDKTYSQSEYALVAKCDRCMDKKREDSTQWYPFTQLRVQFIYRNWMVDEWQKQWIDTNEHGLHSLKMVQRMFNIM